MILAESMNNIEFVSSDKVVLRNFPVVPAKDCLPEWYAKLKADSPNISKCWPVRDIITAGYIIPYPYETEMGIEYNDDVEEIGVVNPVERIGEFHQMMDRMTHPTKFHTHDQCPVPINGKKKSYYKVTLPWRVQTPNGYSSLIMQPFYQFLNDYTVMPAIIDTDEYDHSQVNLPLYLNSQEASFKPGQPFVQIIPFKRDEWEHTLSFKEPTTSSKMNLFLHNMYKRAFHQKKSFK